MCYIVFVRAVSGCNSVVQYLLPKQRVVGSNPIARSIVPASPRYRPYSPETAAYKTVFPV